MTFVIVCIGIIALPFLYVGLVVLKRSNIGAALSVPIFRLKPKQRFKEVKGVIKTHVKHDADKGQKLKKKSYKREFTKN